MTTADPHLRELVPLFLTESRRAFEPWVQSEGGAWTEELVHGDGKGGLIAAAPHNVRGFFLAAGKFETPRVIGEISCGDREFFINTIVSPRNRDLTHGLWEWANALERPDLVPRNTSFVLQPARLQSIVRAMATSLQELAASIAQASDDLVRSMDAARAIVQSAFDSRLRGHDHQRKARQAAEAFVAKDWTRVIELLRSVEDRLSAAEEGKLQYALRQRGLREPGQ